jgi:hypothetical protein
MPARAVRQWNASINFVMGEPSYALRWMPHETDVTDLVFVAFHAIPLGSAKRRRGIKADDLD